MPADGSWTRRRAHPRTTWARALWVTCSLALATCLYHGAVVTADLSGRVQVRPKTQLIPEDISARKDLYAIEAQEHPSDVFGEHVARLLDASDDSLKSNANGSSLSRGETLYCVMLILIVFGWVWLVSPWFSFP